MIQSPRSGIGTLVFDPFTLSAVSIRSVADFFSDAAGVNFPTLRTYASPGHNPIRAMTSTMVRYRSGISVNSRASSFSFRVSLPVLGPTTPPLHPLRPRTATLRLRDRVDGEPALLDREAEDDAEHRPGLVPHLRAGDACEQGLDADGVDLRDRRVPNFGSTYLLQTARRKFNVAAAYVFDVVCSSNTLASVRRAPLGSCHSPRPRLPSSSKRWAMASRSLENTFLWPRPFTSLHRTPQRSSSSPRSFPGASRSTGRGDTVMSDWIAEFNLPRIVAAARRSPARECASTPSSPRTCSVSDARSRCDLRRSGSSTSAEAPLLTQESLDHPVQDEPELVGPERDGERRPCDQRH